MHIEIWDRTPRGAGGLVGRSKGEGAPLGRRQGVRRGPTDAAGRRPLIAADAHIRLASAQALGGVQILRRGYNFVDGSDGQGHLNAGLFFLAYMRDPQTQFVPMQRALADSDG